MTVLHTTTLQMSPSGHLAHPSGPVGTSSEGGPAWSPGSGDCHSRMTILTYIGRNKMEESMILGAKKLGFFSFFFF